MGSRGVTATDTWTSSQVLLLRHALSSTLSRLIVVRAVLLMVASVLIAVSGGLPRLLPALVAMIAVQVIVSLPLRVLRTPAAALAEGLAVVSVATIPEPASGNLMLLLLTPASIAGLRGGYRWVLATVGVSAFAGAGLILRMPTGFDTQSLIDLFQWSALSMAFGATLAWYVEQQGKEDPIARSYSDAVKALTELSVISRRLPSGLDVRTLSQDALADAVDAVAAERGAVITFGYRGSLDTAAAFPDATTEWLTGVGSLSDWADLAQRGEQTTRRSADGRVCLQPIAVGSAAIAFLLLQVPSAPSQRQSQALQTIGSKHAVPLQAALLFADVRDFATNEERSRIAREIHDGIAQDVAFLGYTVDEILAVAEDPETRALAAALRTEISRVVADVRMSVFSLREGVAPTESLGASIGTHARRVFEDSPTAVHLTINESPNRLRPEIESELLRMTQEAMTNVRRHAAASNVWIYCAVDAPTVSLSVEDDGTGMGPVSDGSYGLRIMRERAARIAANVSISGREGGGTIVEIVV
jgi:signal transduction histidine kinase